MEIIRKHDRVFWNNKYCLVKEVFEDTITIVIISNDPIEAENFRDIEVKISEVELEKPRDQ